MSAIRCTAPEVEIRVFVRPSRRFGKILRRSAFSQAAGDGRASQSLVSAAALLAFTAGAA